MLRKAWRTRASSPSTSVLVAGSMPRMPATNTKSPARAPTLQVAVGAIAPTGERIFTTNSILHHQLDPVGGEADARRGDRFPIGGHVHALDHQQRAAGRKIEPLRLGRVGARGGDPRAVAAVVTDAERREHAGDRAGRLVNLGGVGGARG